MHHLLLEENQGQPEPHRLPVILDFSLIYFPLSHFFRFDSVQQELNKFSSQNKELQREMERLQSEVTRYKNLQLKSAKDCEKYKEERDSVFNEYRLIMSERDQVIKEVDKLQTELESAEARLKNTSSERVVASEELEALRQVLTALDGASL